MDIALFKSSLIAFHFESFSIHFGVFPYRPNYYLKHQNSWWLWGHDFNVYELCLEYWGLGPFFLLVKEP